MTIALVPWGDLIEDFLDGIGVSLDEFSSKMTGGWLFGYIEALRLQGIETVVVCFSARVVSTVRTVHEPTGARIVILRAPGIYRRLRRRMKDPYGCTMQSMFGEKDGGQTGYWRLAHHLAPYLATPTLVLTREIRRAGCTAILCQEYESPRFDALIAVGAMLGIPVFATFQGGNWHRSGWNAGSVLTHSVARPHSSLDPPAKRSESGTSIDSATTASAASSIRWICQSGRLFPGPTRAVTLESIPPRVWRSGTAASTYAERASTSCWTHGGWSNWSDPTVICCSCW